MKTIKIKIVTPERTVYEDEVSQNYSTDNRRRSYYFARPYPLHNRAQSGRNHTQKGDEIIHLATSGGFIEFNNNILTMLADTVERAEEIDLKRAEEAKQRAEELQKQKITLDDIGYAKTAALVKKNSPASKSPANIAQNTKSK